MVANYFVIPAKAGIQLERHGRGIDSFCAADAASWIPAFAGMTRIEWEYKYGR